MGSELAVAFTSTVAFFFILNGLNNLLFNIGSENNSPLYWILFLAYIPITFLLFILGVKHFQKLRHNKNLTSQDKIIGLTVLAILLLIMAYLYIIPYIGIINSLQ